MKRYIYDKNTPVVLKDTGGRQLCTLNRGDIIEARSDGDYNHGSSVIKLYKADLKKNFKRIYTEEEQDRYDRIHEKVLVASMQSLIANLKDCIISVDMHEIENVPKNAIWFADRLVEELKEKEY